jgi:Flp pilus assembly protein TadG
MLRCPSRSFRRAGTTVIVILLLVPLLALVAFAVDLNHIWRTDIELQNAADAAAQAGAMRLMKYMARGNGPLTATAQTALLAETQTAVAQQAVAYGQMHRAGDVNLVVNSSDVELGFVTDPGAASDTANGKFQTGATAPFPNSVRVTVRRDDTVSTGPLPLLFGPVLGTSSSRRVAVATSTLRGQNVTGFKGNGKSLLPLAMSLKSYQYLTGAATAPAGVVHDNYTVTAGRDGGSTPPANVTHGPDGAVEVQIYPDPNSPGNFGLVSLKNSKTTDSNTFITWVLNGASPTDLATFGSNGLQVTAVSNNSVDGGPGLKTPVIDNLVSTIGQSRACMVCGDPSGNGSNATYPVLGFVGVTVVSVDLVNNAVWVQLSALIDSNITLGSGPSTRPGMLVYRGISLSR